jgi:hypothetical protein
LGVPKARNLSPYLPPELNNFIETLNKSTAKDFASESPEDREKLGFRRPILEITLTPNADSESPAVWKLTQATVTEEGAPRTKYYLGEASGSTTYEMNPSFRDAFEIDLMRFRDTVVTDFARGEITKLSIQGPKGPNVQLVKQDGAWKSKVDETLGQAKEDKANEIVSKLGQLRAVEYFDDGNMRRLGLDRPSRIVELTSTHEEGSSTKTLFFGRPLQEGLYTVNSEGLSSPALCQTGSRLTSSHEIDAYRVEAPKAPSSPPSSDKVQKGKKVKPKAP